MGLPKPSLRRIGLFVGSCKDARPPLHEDAAPDAASVAQMQLGRLPGTTVRPRVESTRAAPAPAARTGHGLGFGRWIGP
jgi:hypothetical protein